jgi:DNA replication protein DnaC
VRVSSNITFSAWAEIFGDRVAAAALIDRLTDHAEGHRRQGRARGLAVTTEPLRGAGVGVE